MNDASPWNAAGATTDAEHSHEYSIDTPEQVALRFPLAGLGSRFLALLLDLALQVAANMVLFIGVLIAFAAAGGTGMLHRLSDTGGKWFAAGIILIYFLLFWGYFSLFEAFRNGQTPGKQVLKIRVIKDSGRQITFFEALARNLLRVVDALPGVYLVGTISILATRQNKRLGDMVADTIVIHERVDDFAGYLAMPAAALHPWASSADQQPVALSIPGMPADRIARLGPDDLHLIDTYLSRALMLPLEARGRLASRMLDGLCAKMDVPVPVEQAPERSLEALSYAMRSRTRG